ncbi:polysaccharide biosynthesis C-terminal domain-containing protein [Cohaesibacter gelatinilyticus]|uniref:Membrane protein involved in the export of O-antigen and teichoic acid n=1 Tax=Cohaesibacter gelatinilyticus TaxID=372072 RepID=A0A285PGT2_9HYPH|nr:polysaccharide biosynthesis C-terminal domain-containing protein [Cohaesibacter gelatinilyticus]SNZ20904.1 Membrane protein involved in the export of O-antigen and teichoic acid [Cohaesibacter gelatinilyticus]
MAQPTYQSDEQTVFSTAIKKQAILTFAIRLAGAGLLYLLQIFLARLLGEQDYGLYALVWVWVIVLSQISCMGFNTAILRFLPQYLLHDKASTAHDFLLTARNTALGFASLFAIIGLVGTFAFSSWLEQNHLWPIYLGMACLPLFALGEIYEGAALARSHILTALLPSFILRPLLVFIFLLAAYLLGLPSNATTAMQAALLATALATTIQVLGANRILKSALIDSSEQSVNGTSDHQQLFWFQTSGPLVLLDGFYLITLNADIILLGLLVGPEPIAIYYAAVKTLALVAYIHFATSLVAARPFANLFASKADMREINALYRKMTHWTLWPSIITALAIIVLAPYILRLFGSNYMQGQSVITILTIGLIFQGAVGPVQNVLNMAGQQKMSAKSAFAAMAINIALNLLLIPIWGIQGAAIATTIGTITQSIMMLWLANKTLGLYPAFLPHPKATPIRTTVQAR